MYGSVSLLSSTAFPVSLKRNAVVQLPSIETSIMSVSFVHYINFDEKFFVIWAAKIQSDPVPSCQSDTTPPVEKLNLKRLTLTLADPEQAGL